MPELTTEDIDVFKALKWPKDGQPAPEGFFAALVTFVEDAQTLAETHEAE